MNDERHPFAGKIDDPEVREQLVKMKERYDPYFHESLPENFEDTEFMKQQLREAADEVMDRD